MKILKYKLWILLVCLGQFGIQSCQKGNLDEAFVDFARISMESINNLYVDSLEVDGIGAKILQGYYIFPYNKNKDSIELTIYYDGKTKSVKEKVSNKKELNKIFIYSDFIDENKIVVTQSHPLTDEKVEEGYNLFKFYGSNLNLFPDGKPFHLAIYQITNDGKDGNPLTYSENPIDTIFNISNDFPKTYFKVKQQAEFKSIKVKLLNNDKQELLFNGKPVYAFIKNNSTKPFIFIYKINSEAELRPFFRRDPNLNASHLDGGYTAMVFLNIFMSY